MTTDRGSPLQGIATFDELLSMPYFEMLACLGELSLHPGGLNSTVGLLRAAKVRDGDRILEIGCGTGLTTRALLSAGLDVSVVEPCERMLKATLRNCDLGAKRRPKYYRASAEDLTGVPAMTYDLVLYECVFGFVSDHRRAISECARVLSSDSARVCVTDLHYIAEPTAAVRARLREVFGREIAVLQERDWRALFAGFESCHWTTSELPEVHAPEPSEIKACLDRACLREQIPGLGDERFERIAERWRSWNAIFSENKRYMRAHHAVWRKVR